MKTLVLMGILALTKPGLAGSRIAEGVATVAKIEDAPFSVALTTRRFSNNLFPHCTGTIIDPEWVLTAAHCIFQHPKNISQVLIVAGANDIFEFWAYVQPYVQVRLARKAIFHPKHWRTITLIGRYDVALIKVDKFIFDARVNKADMWARPWVPAAPNAEVEYGILNCTAYGWGVLSSDQAGKTKFTTNLMTAPVKAMHGKKACPYEQMFRNRRIICCLERALCPGDSGGPLVWNNSVVGVAHVIRSKGGENRNCDSDSMFSIWIYMCPMLDFVHKHVPSVPATPESCSSPQFPPTCIVVAIGLCYATALAYF